MIVLGLDATSDRLSVAVSAGGRMAERTLEGARRHAGALLNLIGEAREAVQAAGQPFDVVAVADGPGSFTGLRVSFAAAKAMVRQGARLVVAPSLLLRAAAVTRSGRVLALSPALRGEAYGGIWSLAPDRITPVLLPRTLSLPDLVALPSVDRIVGTPPPEFAGRLPRPVEPSLPSAAILLRLLEIPGAVQPVAEPALFEPAYGRPAEAQAKWERDHGRPLPDPR